MTIMNISRRPESNQRLRELQSLALPTELRQVVPQPGIEHGTFSLRRTAGRIQERCSTAELLRQKGPTGNRTQISRVRISRPNHWTIEPRGDQQSQSLHREDLIIRQNNRDPQENVVESLGHDVCYFDRHSRSVIRTLSLDATCSPPSYTGRGPCRNQTSHDPQRSRCSFRSRMGGGSL